MRVLFVSPHADDVCLSVGAIIAGMTTEKAIVTVFSRSAWAEPDWDGPTDIEAISAVRAEEDRRYCALRGLDHHALGLEDSAVRHGMSGNLRRPSGDEPALVRAAARGIREVVETGAFDLVFGPLSIGGHADHRVCRKAVEVVRDEIGENVLFYEDVPYVMELSLRALDRSARRVGRKARPLLCGTRVPVEDKRADFSLYASQRNRDVVEAVRRHSDRLSALTERVTRGVTERLWTSAPAVTVASVLGSEVMVEEGARAGGLLGFVR